MKNLLLILFFASSIFHTQAQDIWVNSVMGKPHMAHFDAMKAVAKEWGINYEAKFMGCKRTKAMVAESKKIDKSNQKYFTKLAEKFGKDWQKRFMFDVQKRKPIYTSVENPLWKAPVIGKPYMAYFDTKKAVAKEWGINYEPVFLGCMPDKPGVEEQHAEAQTSSKQYLADIEGHFGKGWEELLEAEVQARLKVNNDK